MEVSRETPEQLRAAAREVDDLRFAPHAAPEAAKSPAPELDRVSEPEDHAPRVRGAQRPLGR